MKLSWKLDLELEIFRRFAVQCCPPPAPPAQPSDKSEVVMRTTLSLPNRQRVQRRQPFECDPKKLILFQNFLFISKTSLKETSPNVTFLHFSIHLPFSVLLVSPSQCAILPG